MAVLLVVLMALMFLKPQRFTGPPHPVPQDVLRKPIIWIAVTLIGFYTGFIQVGSNYLLLFVLVLWGGFDVMHGNSFKLLAQLALTLLALPVYLAHGMVEWRSGLLLTAGSIIGAWIGSMVAIRRGAKFVRILIAVTVIAFAGKLLFF